MTMGRGHISDRLERIARRQFKLAAVAVVAWVFLWAVNADETSPSLYRVVWWAAAVTFCVWITAAVLSIIFEPTTTERSPRS